MGRKRQRQQGDGEAGAERKIKGQQHHGEGIPDPPAAVIAIHPSEAVVVVAAGPEVRIYDNRLQEVKTLWHKSEGTEANKQIIRGLAFDAAGRHLVAGCDDKNQGLLLWDCSTWEQLQSLKVPKRVSAVALTNDGAYMLAADKFGDVHVAPTKPGVATHPELLLGHFCSILTSVNVSHCGRCVVTTDRDHKARVSVLPAQPLGGADDIQSFCLGHTSFVTCSAFVAQGGKELLVTGGADGTVRLWDHITGTLLSTWDSQQQQQQQGGEAADAESEGEAAAAEEQHLQEGEGLEQEGAANGEGQQQSEVTPAEAQGTESEDVEGNVSAVLSVAASPDGCWVAAVVEDRDDVALLRVSWQEQDLHEEGWRTLQGLHMPTQLAFGRGNKLWAVGGPPTETSVSVFLACAAIGGDGLSSGEFPDDALPAEVRSKLEALDGSEVAALAAADEARRRRAARVSALLRQRKYGQEEIEERKLKRRDVRAKMAAAAATAAIGEVRGRK